MIWKCKNCNFEWSYSLEKCPICYKKGDQKEE